MHHEAPFGYHFPHLPWKGGGAVQFEKTDRITKILKNFAKRTVEDTVPHPTHSSSEFSQWKTFIPSWQTEHSK